MRSNEPKMKRTYMRNNPMRYFPCLCFLLFFSAAQAEELVHVLQKGETLYGISRKYNVPPETLLSWNEIANPDKLQAGQKIRIPDVYTVQKGDTLYGIARKLDVSVTTLMQSNKLSANSTIKAGETLYIPSGTAVAAATKTPAAKQPEKTVVPASEIIPQKPLVDPRLFQTKKVDSSIIWPVPVTEISYLSGKIYGVSITSLKGEKVKAISSGTVLSTGPYRGFGQVVFLQSKSGYIYVYGGLDSILTRAGESLAFGDEIGTLGSDSLSGKPRLYLMVYNKDLPVDPAKAPRGY